MTDIRLDRTFWPVGHGAFYTERFFNHVDNNVFTAIYDCGGKDQAVVQRIIDQIILHDNHVDYLFISHFHRDHINGLRYLLTKAQVDHIVIPQIEETRLVESYIYNAITATDLSTENDDAQVFIRRQLDTRDLRVESIIEVEPLVADTIPELRSEGRRQYIPSGHPIYIQANSHDPYWIYIPVNIDYDKTKRQKLTAALNKICTDCAEKPIIESGVINWNSIDAILNKKMKEVKDAYKQVFQSHNAYSMPVFSGPVIGTHISWRLYDCDFFDDYVEQYNWFEWRFRRHHLFGKRLLSCLYMGDFEASTPDNLLKLERLLKEYYYLTGLQQVPHHYSKYNHDIDLYEDRVLAFGNIDDHKDVSFCHSIYNEIHRITYLPPLIITEEDTPKSINYSMFI